MYYDDCKNLDYNEDSDVETNGDDTDDVEIKPSDNIIKCLIYP